MAHVEKRGPGRWRARWRLPSGVERSRTFPRRIDAERYLTRVEATKLTGAAVDPRLGRETVGAWVQRWRATRVDLRPSSKAREDGILDQHVLPRFGDVPLGRVDQLAVRAWVADHVPPRDRAAILVAGHGGLRFSELAGLRRRRVDPLRGRVHVVEVLVESGGRLHTGAPKTRAGRRTVPLPRRVVDELAGHLAGDAENYVFTSPNGGPLRRAGFRSRVFVPAVDRAGLAPLRLHDLRHTAVSLWIAAGANAKQVAAWAGHSSAGFSLDRYGHLLDDADERVIAALDQRLDDARPAAGGSVHRLGS